MARSFVVHVQHVLLTALGVILLAAAPGWAQSFPVVTPQFIVGGGGYAVTADDTHVYWTVGDFGATSIGRATLDGSNVDANFIPGLISTLGVAVDANFIYWTDYHNGNIGRANLDGTSPDVGFIAGASHPASVAAHGGYLYWSNNGGHSIGRANLDGSGVDQSFITVVGPPMGLAVRGGHIFWANQWGTVGRAALDGSDVQQDFVIVPYHFHTANGVAVDGSHIYYGNNLTIGRANLDGTNPQDGFIHPGGAAFGLALNGNILHWANYFGGAVGRAEISAPALPPGPYATAVLEDAPRAYFRLGDAGPTVADSSGNGASGTASSNVTFGQPGALLADADTVAVFGGGSIQTDVIQAAVTEYTLEAWVKTSSAGALTIFSNRRSDGYPDKGFGLFVGPVWHTGPGTVTLALNGDNTFIGIGSTTTINDGEWHHVVGVFAGGGPVDTSQFTIYIDGVAESSTVPAHYDLGYYTGAAATPLTGDTTGTIIGGFVDTSINFLGSIDEAAIYHHALPAGRVMAHYRANAPVPLDTTAPVASPSQSPAANGAGWNTTPVVVSWNWADEAGGSGIDSDNCTASDTTAGEGTNVFVAACSDLAGNSSSATYTVNVDMTAPAVQAEATANGSPYLPGTWTKHDVVVSFTCTDAGSGVASVSSPVAVSGEGSNLSAGGTCTDIAGHSAAAAFGPIQIDLTAPTVTASLVAIRGGGDDDSAQWFRVRVSAADGAGIATQTASLNGVAVTNGQFVRLKTTKRGPQRVRHLGPILLIDAPSFLLTATAVDAAGNSASATAVPLFNRHGRNDRHDDDEDDDRDRRR